MSLEMLKSTAEKLVGHCRAHTEDAGAASELYHPDAVSVEAIPMPGSDSAETKGVEGIKGKHEWWGARWRCIPKRRRAPTCTATTASR